MKTILYIDGFNLYYGALRKTPHRWLNPLALAAVLFPKNHIVGIKYCSAKIDPAIGDPNALTRQMTYWRALRTLPNLTIVEGQFRTRKKRAKVVHPPPPTIEIYQNEEKGSDVNLASHLLLDAFTDQFEVAIVISGDSDLITPIRMVRDTVGKPIGVLNPQRLSGPNKPKPRQNAGLKSAATFYKNGISWNQLAQSTFSATLTDAQGTFNKPASW